MEAVLQTWSPTELKAECQKRGMAQYGNKAQLIQRILDNIPGKRKPGPKPGPKPGGLDKIISKSKTLTSIAQRTASQAGDKAASAAKTRKALLGLGVTDKKAQANAPAAIKTLPIKLDVKHMKSLGLCDMEEDTDANGNTVYKYKYAASSKMSGKTKAAPKSKPAAVEEEVVVVDDDASESGSERSDDLMDNDTFNQYKEKLASRLEDRRMPNKLLVDFIKVYDPGQKLAGVDKADLAKRAVEQLMYETDAEEDEE